MGNGEQGAGNGEQGASDVPGTHETPCCGDGVTVRCRAMNITTRDVELVVDGSPMRVHVAAPARDGAFPGIVFYSDIFQITDVMRRACARLAGYGFVVAAPEIYHRTEPPFTALPFDDAGRTRGLAGAAATAVAAFDADTCAVLAWLSSEPTVARDARGAQLGAAGFCLGGHLAFRAALEPRVRATCCFYGTGIHNGKLGRDADAGSLGRAAEVKGELLLVFGTRDPHIPLEAREAIESALRRAGPSFAIELYDAEHAFMRDEGPRYDAEATDLAWASMIALFRRTLA
jgi:carboxymethylenebutenolidase